MIKILESLDNANFGCCGRAWMFTSRNIKTDRVPMPYWIRIYIYIYIYRYRYRYRISPNIPNLSWI